MNEFKIGDNIVTSRGLYGRILSLQEHTAEIKLGSKTHIIDLSQIFHRNRFINVKVSYEMEYCSHKITDTKLVGIPSGTDILDIESIKRIALEEISKIIKENVNIKEIILV